MENLKVFLTGAFGNVGFETIQVLLDLNYRVKAFDLETKANKRIAKNYQEQIEICWGDICTADFNQLLIDVDLVIHLAAIIPPTTDSIPEIAYDVNVNGTKRLIRAMQEVMKTPALLFASSVSVYGERGRNSPPVTLADGLKPTDVYSTHKVECEEFIRASSIKWAIFRLGVVSPLELGGFDPIMFEISLDSQIEFVHPHDVALAFVHAIEEKEVWGKTLLIGGGPACQMYYHDFVTRLLSSFGVGALPKEAFGSKPFYTAFMDTSESQALLNYQTTSFESYAQQLKASMGSKHVFAEMFSPLIQYWLKNQSPHYKGSKK